MKKSLKIATVLSWFNLIVWGLISLLFALFAIMSGNLSVLIITFLNGVIVLHSYAALQLQKSIRNPSIPLSSQTPVGIRFIGFIALFFGVLYLADGIAMLQNSQEIIKLLEPQLPPEAKKLNLSAIMRAGAIFSLLTGLSVAINVSLNFRLLRWYLFSQQQPRRDP